MKKIVIVILVAVVCIPFSYTQSHAENKLPLVFKKRKMVNKTIEVPLYPESNSKQASKKTPKKRFKEKKSSKSQNLKKDQSPKIELAIRIINPDSKNPYLFFVGGGPGFESINSYNTLGFKGGMDFSELAEKYRIVLFDQRGVGNSSPLDVESDETSVQFMYEHFSTKSHSHDLNHIIKELTLPGEEFYIAGHSYGGYVIADYISRIEQFKRPTGVILLAPAFFSINMQEFINERTRFQIELNKQFFGSDFEYQNKIILAKKKIREFSRKDFSSGLKPYDLDTLFVHLNVNRVNLIKEIVDKIIDDKVESAQKIKQIVGKSIPFDDLTAYVLDWSFGNRASQEELVRDVEPSIQGSRRGWMLLEANVLMSRTNKRTLESNFSQRMNEVDSELAMSFNREDFESLAKNIKNLPLLMIVGESDPFVPFHLIKEKFYQVYNPDKHYFESITGGDHWVMLSDYGNFINQQMERLKSAQANCNSQLSN
ncbi:MAG: alpha/beta hydrolase [Bdellovibrionaceae bacterium]|nr:alpha/beta hydrolase [Pseudobdellovibrionaceae bacterium]